MLRPLLLLFLCLFVPCCGRPVAAHGDVNNAHAPAALIQPLIDPVKLATLGDRGANSRIQKITAILWEAKANGRDPAKVAGEAVGLIGWGGTEKGGITAAAMVRNVTILVALRHGFPHGGWCPAGRKSLDGPLPARYLLTETPSADYLQRTEWNVRDTDGTVVFTLAREATGGSLKTIGLPKSTANPASTSRGIAAITWIRL